MAYGADVRRALVQLFVHCGDRDRSSVGYYRGFRPQKKTSGMELQVQGSCLVIDQRHVLVGYYVFLHKCLRFLHAKESRR